MIDCKQDKRDMLLSDRKAVTEHAKSGDCQGWDESIRFSSLQDTCTEYSIDMG